MDLSPIVGKIDVIRRRVRSLILVDGFSRALLLAFACAVLTFLIDYFVPKVPLQVRFTLLVVSLGSVAWAIWRYVAYPLGVRITDDDIALCVEKQYPDLNDRLISAIQLSREGPQYARFNSPQLVDSLVAEALRESGNLDFSPVISGATTRKLALWTAVAAAALAGIGIWQKDAVRIWALRLVSDSVQWPKKTRIAVVSPAAREVTVAKGDDLTVEIETSGVLPKKATLYYRFSSAGEPVQRPMRAEGGGKFRFDFPKVIEPVEFWIEAGDDETETYKVAVLNPPTVEKVTLLYDYPDYTGLKDTSPTAPVEDGNIVAPVGTKVKVSAWTNLDIAQAKILVGARGEEDIRDIEVRANAQGQPRVVMAEVDVRTNTHYALWLKATNGLQTSSPVRYSIKATEDKAPEIRISEPNADKHATPQAMIPLRVATIDDFGVTELKLIIRTNAPNKPEQVVPLDAFNTESYPAKRIDTEYVFDMATLGFKEGTVVQYQVVAKDGREIPQANETKSRVFQFTIIKREDMLKRIEDMLARIREELRRIIAFQESGRADTNRLMDVLGKKDLLETMERQAVNAAGANQRRITQHLERVLREFEEIVKDMKYNKLFEGSAENKLKKPEDMLRALAVTKSPDVATLISQAASLAQGSDRFDKLAKTDTDQEEILNDLNTILALLTEYETYMEVVRHVRELLNNAIRNRDEMRKIQPK
ncbi:MAG: hypothetical protein HYY18_11965 [Planctomycetes bacterium]|nr:hypothetical protein [Planctomycetota bacterium]